MTLSGEKLCSLGRTWSQWMYTFVRWKAKKLIPAKTS